MNYTLILSAALCTLGAMPCTYGMLQLNAEDSLSQSLNTTLAGIETLLQAETSLAQEVTKRRAALAEQVRAKNPQAMTADCTLMQVWHLLQADCTLEEKLGFLRVVPQALEGSAEPIERIKQYYERFCVHKV